MPYGKWAADGLIEVTPGRATDRAAIVRRLADIRGRDDVQLIGYDRWRFEDLNKLLDDEGIDLPMTEFVPGFRSYAPAVDAFERALLDGRNRYMAARDLGIEYPRVEFHGDDPQTDDARAANALRSAAQCFQRLARIHWRGC